MGRENNKKGEKNMQPKQEIFTTSTGTSFSTSTEASTGIYFNPAVSASSTIFIEQYYKDRVETLEKEVALLKEKLANIEENLNNTKPAFTPEFTGELCRTKLKDLIENPQ